MILDHTFGELLEACIAVNLGYLALDRFRYRDSIIQILKEASSHIEGMPEKYRHDKAWLDLDIMQKTQGPGSKAAPVLHFLFQNVFNTSADRWVAFIAVVIGFVTLGWRAAHAELPSLANLAQYEYWLLNFFMLTLLLAGLFVFFGRRCVRAVSDKVRENIDHLGAQYKSENESAAQKLLQFTQELNVQSHGI